MSVTALDLITAAFENLNVFQPGASIPAADSTSALARLNRMISQWATQSTTVPFIAREVFPLVAGKGGPSLPYTIGLGGNFNIVRPSSQKAITGVGLLLAPVASAPAVEIPRAMATDDGYQAIAIKELQNALFTLLYYNATYAAGLGSINLWPVPNTTLHSLVLYHEAPLGQFADLSTTTYTFPDGVEEALIYNLERRLATPWGRAMPDEDQLLASQGLRLIKRNNVQLTDMPNAFGRDRRSGYDINVGGSHSGGA